MQPNDRGYRHPYPRAEDRRTEKRQVDGKVEVSGSVEANLPPALINEYVANNESTERWENKKFGLEIATLWFVILTATFTGIQSCQSIHSAKSARDSVSLYKSATNEATRTEIQVNVPLLLPDGLSAEREVIDGSDVITFHQNLRNWGKSKADNPEIDWGIGKECGIPLDFARHDSRKQWAMVPNQTLELDMSIPASQLPEIRESDNPMYEFGTISYDDSFATDEDVHKSRTHIAKWCLRLDTLTLNPVSISGHRTKKYNCIECQKNE